MHAFAQDSERGSGTLPSSSVVPLPLRYGFKQISRKGSLFLVLAVEPHSEKSHCGESGNTEQGRQYHLQSEVVSLRRFCLSVNVFSFYTACRNVGWRYAFGRRR